LDFPWLGKCCVLFLLDLYIYFGFPLPRLKWSSLLKLVRLPLQEEDEDESPQVNTDETDEEVRYTCPAFDDDLDSEDDDFTIEEDDHLFMMMVHPVDPHYFVCASSTVSRHLAEVFAKNSKLKGFEDHAIELEREPSPGFHKVYLMTLTEQTEMDTFLEEALATGRIGQSKWSPSLLHQEERWEAPLHPGLPDAECHHQEESVSAPPHQ
jgi:hypothetical protein